MNNIDEMLSREGRKKMKKALKESGGLTAFKGKNFLYCVAEYIDPKYGSDSYDYLTEIYDWEKPYGKTEFGTNFDLDKECPMNGYPIGAFFTQKWAYGGWTKPIIPRNMVKEAFLENDWKVLCSGVRFKFRGQDERFRAVCVEPKKGVTKKQIREKIEETTEVFKPEKGWYDIEVEGSSAGYYRILDDVFNVKSVEL